MPSPMTPFTVNPTNHQQLALLAGLNAPKAMMAAPPLLPAVDAGPPVAINAGASIAQQQSERARAEAAALAGERAMQEKAVQGMIDLGNINVAHNQARMRFDEQIVKDREVFTQRKAAERLSEKRALDERNTSYPQIRIAMAEDIYAHIYWHKGNKHTYTKKFPTLTGKQIYAEDFRNKILLRGFALDAQGGKTDLGVGIDLKDAGGNVAAYGGRPWKAVALQVIAADPALKKAFEDEIARELKRLDDIIMARYQRSLSNSRSITQGGLGVTPDMEGWNKEIDLRIKSGGKRQNIVTSPSAPQKTTPNPLLPQPSNPPTP